MPRPVVIQGPPGSTNKAVYLEPTPKVIVEALPNVEGNLLGVVLFRPDDDRIEGLKSGERLVDGCLVIGCIERRDFSRI